MKLSVSLPEADVALLDSYALTAGMGSRSAVIQRALTLLRQTGLEEDYEAAWGEWEGSGEQAAWAGASADGLVDAAR